MQFWLYIGENFYNLVIKKIFSFALLKVHALQSKEAREEKVSFRNFPTSFGMPCKYIMYMYLARDSVLHIGNFHLE